MLKMMFFKVAGVMLIIFGVWPWSDSMPTFATKADGNIIDFIGRLYFSQKPTSWVNINFIIAILFERHINKCITFH